MMAIDHTPELQTNSLKDKKMYSIKKCTSRCPSRKCKSESMKKIKCVSQKKPWQNREEFLK